MDTGLEQTFLQRRCVEIKTLVHSWWEYTMMQPLFKQYGGFSEPLKTELPDDPEILLLDIYPKELKVGAQRDICTPMFVAALFTIAKRRKQSKCPLLDERTKNCCVYKR